MSTARSLPSTVDDGHPTNTAENGCSSDSPSTVTVVRSRYIRRGDADGARLAPLPLVLVRPWRSPALFQQGTSETGMRLTMADSWHRAHHHALRGFRS